VQIYSFFHEVQKKLTKKSKKLPSSRVEGSFSSVIGLPMHLVRELLLFSGYSFERDP
jgi:predicted house-cleaning NTP pyrophosphatase (Maf/HAM1 superfamily)